MTRYIALHGLPLSQGLFFFVAPNSKSFAITAYTQNLSQPDQIVVRRLLIDLNNITRTDIESISGLFGLAKYPKEIVQQFIDALPYKKVGEDFFANYHNYFQHISKALSSKKVFSDETKFYEFTQKFFGRIVFLYFLQKKGWLEKNTAFLKNKRQRLNGEQLFDFLYSIFDKLNNDKRSDQDLEAIPFLNGSLFEKEDYDDKTVKTIRGICAPILPELFDTLDGYNFTISESTPLDKEVAVDPELLGNIFESMLPETERGDKGTFYTHQDEMLFMAREGFRSYLNRFPDLLTSEQVNKLVYPQTEKNGFKIEPKKAREIKDKLKQVKILDPAVGSGGFLLSALQTMLDIRRKLNGVIGTLEQEYDMKLEAIENCFFGVDIESEAIELSKLRLWLTLVVDESVENVRKLPNLDYNLYRGDSLKLSDVDKGVITRFDTDPEIRKALTRSIKELRIRFIESHGKEKEEIFKEMERTIKKLIKVNTGQDPPDPLPFSYRYTFPDIMEDGGFDIILMNPPYIRQEDIGRLAGQNGKAYKDEIVKDIQAITKDKFTPDKKSDISIYFHVRVMSLLKKEGVAVVIASSKWLDVGYGAPLQDYLLNNTAIDCVLESVDRSFSAMVNVIITVIRKAEKQAQNPVRFVFFKRPFRDVGAKTLIEIYSETQMKEEPLYRLRLKKQDELLKDGYPKSGKTIDPKGVIPLSTSDDDEDEKKKDRAYIGSKWGNVWLRSPEVYFKIIKNAHTKFSRFDKDYYTQFGTKTTPDEFFVLKIIDEGNKGYVQCVNGMDYKFSLELDYCPPLLKNPEDVAKFIDKPTDLKTCVFYCMNERKKLKGTHASSYIEWGEQSPEAFVTIIKGSQKGRKVRVSKVPSVIGRADLWYQLPDVKPANIFLPMFNKNRHLIVGSSVPTLCSANFRPVYNKEKKDNTANLWLYFNSMVFRLFMELYGRIEGEGVLQLMVEEYKLCPVISPLPELSKKFKMINQFKKRDAYKIVNIVEEGTLELEQPDRKELDDLVLKELGFIDKAERDSVIRDLYAWLQYFIRWRLEKPLHAPKSPSKKAGRSTQKGLQISLKGF